MATLNAKEQKLLADRVTVFKAYKKHTQRQADLIALAEKTTRNDDEVKRLKALLDIEQKALDLATSQKNLEKLAKAEKDKERRIFEHGTYQLGGLFRALLKNNDTAFIRAFRQAVQDEKIKMTYKDKEQDGKEYPIFTEYSNLLNGSPVSPQATQTAQGTNTLPHPQNG
jgi:hypothetical protein